jgi:hypothetical protein
METEMGYRGSKSVLVFSTVKEQRVDGSWGLIKNNSSAISNNKSLRCTLTGFERNYQIKLLSNQLNKLSFSTINNKPKLNPWFITGFTDAEGCFSISIQSNNRLKTKWRVLPVFLINIHIKDIAILEDIKTL